MLALESAAFDRGVASARRSLTGLEGGFSRTGGQVIQFSKQVGQAERSAGSARAWLQNFGYQVQDLAVQIAGGTSASRALAQQLPQLLSGFGLLGVALGTASAVLIPMAGNLFDAGDSAEEAAAKIDMLESSIKDLKQANEAFDLSGIQGLIDKYGELDAAVVLMLSRQQKAKEAAVINAAKTATESIGAELETIKGLLKAYDSFVKASLSDPIYFPQAMQFAQGLQDEFSLTTVEARDLLAALEALKQSNGLQETAAAAADLSGKLEKSSLAGGTLTDSLLAVQDMALQGANAMAGMPGFLGAAVDQASGLAGALWDAAQAAFSVTQNQAAARAASIASYEGTASATGLAGPDGVISEMNGGGRFVPRVRGAGLPAVAAPRRGGGGGGRRGGGGGGGAGAGGGQSETAREAARIFDETRTAAEKYAIELEKLNNLKQAGALSDDTYARAMESLKDKTGETADAMKDLEISVGSAFVSFVTGAKSGREALQGLLSSLGETLANQAWRQLAGSGFFGDGKGSFWKGLIKNADGNAFSNGRVQAFAQGGIVTGPTMFPMPGGVGLMGEAGPEAIMPLTRIGGKLGVLASGMGGGQSGPSIGGGVVINVDARGATEGTAAQIARALQAAAPQIIRASVQASRGASARGA